MWPQNAVFFSDDGALIDPGDAATSSAQGLAQRVLALGQPSWRTFWQARRDGRARLLIAVGLLREVLRRETSGWTVAAERLWPEVQDAWRSLSGDKAERAALTSLAAELDIGTADEVIASIVNASAHELFPMLHAILHAGVLAGGTTSHQAFHLKALADSVHAHANAAEYRDEVGRLHLTPGRSSESDAFPRHVLGIERVAYSRALSSAGRDVEAFAALVSAVPYLPDAAQRAAVAAEAITLARRATEGTLDLSVERCREILLHTEELSRALPRNFSTRRLQARVEMALGIALIKHQRAFNDAGLRFARAVVLDALSAEPDNLLEETRRALAKHAEAIQTVLNSGRPLSIAGHQLKAEVAGGLAKADEFASTAEGQELRRGVTEAVVSQACSRLGLDPGASDSVDALRALLGGLARLDADAPDVSALREELGARFPQLRAAPWERVSQVAREYKRVTAAVLAELLHAPTIAVDLRTHAALERAYGRLAERFKGSRRLRLDLLDGWLARLWLFSRRDWGVKALALIGSILLAGSMSIHGYHHVLAAVRDADYRRFRTAEEASRPDETLAAGRSFLRHLEGDVTDYKLSEIANPLALVLLQSMAAAARDGDDARLDALGSDARTLTDRLHSARPAIR